jgi:hypothetical protein
MRRGVLYLEPKKKLKDFDIKLGVVSSELLSHPTSQGRSLIVEENASVSD